MSHQPDNIPAGTQVVTLIEARGPNGSVVHPRGAVGIVTRTPAVPGENFLVRFPDGVEKSLARSQIEVLKHFKDRLGHRLLPIAAVHNLVQQPKGARQSVVWRIVAFNTA